MGSRLFAIYLQIFGHFYDGFIKVPKKNGKIDTKNEEKPQPIITQTGDF